MLSVAEAHVVTVVGPSTTPEALPNAILIWGAGSGVVVAEACANGYMARSCTGGEEEPGELDADQLEPQCCSALTISQSLCACVVLLVCCPIIAILV